MTDEEATRIAMQGKIIRCCGDCAMYNLKKHKCTLGHNKESNPRDKFFDDCGLEDIEKHDAEVRAEAINEFIKLCDSHAKYDAKKHPQNAYCIDRLTLLKIAEQLKEKKDDNNND